MDRYDYYENDGVCQDCIESDWFDHVHVQIVVVPLIFPLDDIRVSLGADVYDNIVDEGS